MIYYNSFSFVKVKFFNYSCLMRSWLALGETVYMQFYAKIIRFCVTSFLFVIITFSVKNMQLKAKFHYKVNLKHIFQ